MFFEDEEGKILSMEEVNNLMFWEFDEKTIHTFEPKDFLDQKTITQDSFSKHSSYEKEFDYHEEIVEDHIGWEY